MNCDTGELIGYWRICGEAVLPKKHSFTLGTQGPEAGHNNDFGFTRLVPFCVITNFSETYFTLK